MGILDWLFGGSGDRPPTRRRYVTMETESGEKVRVPAGAAKAIVKMQQRGLHPTYRGKAASGWRRVAKRNPRLSAAARQGLPDSAFAAPEIRALPIHDAGHVRSAIGHFSQQQFRSKREAQAAARRIVEAAQRHGVPVRATSTVATMAGLYVERVPDRRRNLDAFIDGNGVIHPIRGSEGYDEIMLSTPYEKAMRAARLATYGGDAEADWRRSWKQDEGDWADAVRKAVKSVSRYGIAPHAGKREGWEYRHDVPLYLKDKRGLPADEVAQLVAYQHPHLGIETEDDLLQALAEGTRERRYNPKRKTPKSHGPSLPHMGPSFGGIQYKPVDVGKGGWGGFMRPDKSPGTDKQGSLFGPEHTPGRGE